MPFLGAGGRPGRLGGWQGWGTSGDPRGVTAHNEAFGQLLPFPAQPPQNSRRQSPLVLDVGRPEHPGPVGGGFLRAPPGAEARTLLSEGSQEAPTRWPRQAIPRGPWSRVQAGEGKGCKVNYFVPCFYDIIILI